jgi:hypothetical protein
MQLRPVVIALAITSILTSCSQPPLAPTETTVARSSVRAFVGTGQADPVVITGTTSESSSEPSNAIAPDSTGNSAVGLGWMGGGH